MYRDCELIVGIEKDCGNSPLRPRPTVLNSAYVTLGPEVHEKMLRSGGQSDAKRSVLSSQASLVLICRPTEGDERMGQPCRAPGLNLGPVMRKRDALTTQPLGFVNRLTK
ncbi:hypothetical protein TNCV_1735301 [Trichonephila clavipes]|nr:hypothetical protein TNCV_1735301 [Trichonephila clavipes]